MEPMTTLVLAFQLIALFSIAGALIIYLICKVRDAAAIKLTPRPGPILITSADTALGLQLCTHLAKKGCRVFAGMKDPKDSLSAKLLDAWLKMRECYDEPVSGAIIPMQLDVTREDTLHEATMQMGAHLNLDEKGIAAVINTSGSYFRGRIELQSVQHWEQMMKTNIVGALRVAKTFLGYLRYTQGRLIYLGAGNDVEGEELTAFNASRMAVERCVNELRAELQVYDVAVVSLDTSGIAAESLYRAPMPQSAADAENGPKQYSADVLSANSLHIIERALWEPMPQKRYQLWVPNSKCNLTLPFRSNLRLLQKQPSNSDNTTATTATKISHN